MAKNSYYDTYEMKFVDEMEDDSNAERYIKMPRYDGVVSFKIKPTYEELEKALDKSCEQLEEFSDELHVFTTSEEWKDWCLKK